MIKVTMGDPNLLERQALVLQGLHQTRHLAAWIDDRSFQGLGAPNDGAVLLQRRHRGDHGADRKLAGLRSIHAPL